MRINATPISATFCGFLIVFLWSTTGALLNHYGIARNLEDDFFLIGAILFFLLPVIFLVVGLDNIRNSTWNPFTRLYWENVKTTGLRMLCCFVGAATFGLGYVYILRAVL